MTPITRKAFHAFHSIAVLLILTAPGLMAHCAAADPGEEKSSSVETAQKLLPVLADDATRLTGSETAAADGMVLPHYDLQIRLEPDHRLVTVK